VSSTLRSWERKKNRQEVLGRKKMRVEEQGVKVQGFSGKDQEPTRALVSRPKKRARAESLDYFISRERILVQKGAWYQAGTLCLS